MIVVSDTTPLITLMKAGQLQILHDLFGRILIPETVFHELTSNIAYDTEAELIRNSTFIEIVTVKNTDYVALLQRATGLDRGESEAIVYADENKADILLMDEEAGRRVARNMNLPIAGSIGILIKAFQNGLLTASEIEESLCRIEKSGRYISASLIQSVRQIINVG